MSTKNSINIMFKKKILDYNEFNRIIKNKIISSLDYLLKEDNYLHKILLPNIKEPITKTEDNTYIFPNNETFKGRILNGILQKGEYTWPNGQTFIGDLSPNNIFNKGGKIIFPNKKGELTGFFKFSKDNIIGENYIIEKAIYKTHKRIYEGSFKNNKLHGKFSIHNTPKHPYYSFKGSYLNGVKHGKFILEVKMFNKKVKITGNCVKGIKNGDFKIFIISDDDSTKEEELIYEQKFKDNYLINSCKQSDLIENKQFLNKKIKNKILCMELYEDEHKLFLLLGSNKYLLIYSIDISKNEIYFEKTINIFKNADINDILYITNNTFLLCSSDSNFKLIQLDLEDRLNTSFNNPYKIDYNYYKLIQEFKGKPNSKNIFCLVKISNDLIISGDCANIIFWKKNNKVEEKSILEIGTNYDENKRMERSKSWIEKVKDLRNFFSCNKDINNENENELKINKKSKEMKKSLDKYVEIKTINLSSHIYCTLKIMNTENEIILAAALPDSQRILFFNINDILVIKKIKELNCLCDNQKVGITKRKKIMTYINNNLFVGCISKILVINLTNYEIEYSVYSEQITFIHSFLDRFLICGVTKELNNLPQKKKETLYQRKEIYYGLN